MSRDHEEFWASLPAKVQHPHRVPTVEALWWIGEPLTAIALVDVLDGEISMWDAAHHFRLLRSLDVVEAVPIGPDQPAPKRPPFDVPYRLKRRDSA